MMRSVDLESRHLASEDSHSRLIRARNESRNPSAGHNASSVCYALSDVYWSNCQRMVKDVCSDDGLPQREKVWSHMREGSELEHWGRSLPMLSFTRCWYEWHLHIFALVIASYMTSPFVYIECNQTEYPLMGMYQWLPSYMVHSL